MATRGSHLEMKVGMFVVCAVIAMLYFVVSVSGMSWMSKRRDFIVTFGFANGLREAAPVRLAGVEAGLVKSMKIYVDTADGKKTKVQAVLSINEGIDIPTDSKITINQLGLLGEKYVEIMPGVSGEFYPVGATIQGVTPVPIEKITEEVSHLTGKLDLTVDTINKDILPDIRDIVHSVKEGKGTVGQFFTDEAMYRNLVELTADLKANPWKLLYRPKQK